jgi:hypothetical protein
MAADPAEATVATPCAAWHRMELHRELPRALMGGTLAMRERGVWNAGAWHPVRRVMHHTLADAMDRAGDHAVAGGTAPAATHVARWLPAEPRESQAAYDRRLQRTVLHNHFKDAVRDLVSRPFSHEVELTEESSPELKELAEDMDLAGTTLTDFAARLCEAAWVDGLAHVYVDFPSADPAGPPPEARTLDDERRMGLRPWFVTVPGGSTIGWRTGQRAGRHELAQLRIRERFVEPAGPWGEAAVEQVRVVEPDAVTLWRLVDDDWLPWGEPMPNTLGLVPLATLYTGHTGFMEAVPPLEDLAWLNLRHWQSQSDQDNILHTARIPILFGAGFQEDEFGGLVEVGANRALRAMDPAARLQWVEHSGRAIESGRQDLQDLEALMLAHRAAMLTRRSGDVTATASALDAARARSELEAVCRACEATLERAFLYAAAWMGLRNAKVGVGIYQEFGLVQGDKAELDNLLKARLAGAISHETYLAELKRRAVLSADVDVNEEIARADAESLPLGLAGREGALVGAAGQFADELV